MAEPVSLAAFIQGRPAKNKVDAWFHAHPGLRAEIDRALLEIPGITYRDILHWLQQTHDYPYSISTIKERFHT